MRGHRCALMLMACVTVVTLVGFPAAHAQKKTVTIGTAGLMGVYYPLGGAICRVVNATRREHNLRCSVEPTEGAGERNHGADDVFGNSGLVAIGVRQQCPRP